MVNLQPFTVPVCKGNATLFRTWLVGANASAGGVWNRTIEPAVQQGLVMGMYRDATHCMTSLLMAENLDLRCIFLLLDPSTLAGLRCRGSDQNTPRIPV